jgi:hypothetical protein
LDKLDESKTSKDQQFRREMDDYNSIIARANEIAKREHQRWELDRFNRMEGSEQDGSG